MRRAGAEQRIAIGHRIGDGFGADQAAGAGAVVDHHLLAEQFWQAAGDNAQHHIRRPTRAIRNNHAYRFVGVDRLRRTRRSGLRVCGSRSGQAYACYPQHQAAKITPHASSIGFFVRAARV